MKKIVIGLFSLLSVSSFGVEVCEVSFFSGSLGAICTDRIFEKSVPPTSSIFVTKYMAEQGYELKASMVYKTKYDNVVKSTFVKP